MKIVFVSDVHLLSKRPAGRIDQILSVQWDKLRFIFEKARSLDKVIVQAGDLFDRPRDWDVLGKFIKLRKEFSDVSFYSIYGQHDMYYRNIDSICNMSILSNLDLVYILNEIPTEIGDYDFYGASFGDKVPKTIKPNKSVLVIHAPISEKDVNIEYKPSLEFLRTNPQFNCILCGDIHIPFLTRHKNKIILNTGCIIRHSRDEYTREYKPFVYIFDTNLNDVSIEYIPAAPFEEIYLEKTQAQNNSLDKFISDMVDKQTKSVNIMDALLKVLANMDDNEPVKEIIYKLLNNQEI